MAVAAVGLLALVLRCWAPGPVTQRVDEDLWLARSEAFRAAVAHGDLERASASPDGQLATLPGATTMWAGAAGRDLARVSAGLGLSAPVSGPSDRSPQVLRAGRALVALATALALVVTVLAGAVLVGRRAALVAGVLMATEPFFVGHGGLLHTDAMVAQFGAAAVVAAAVAGARALAVVGLPVPGLGGEVARDRSPDGSPEDEGGPGVGDGPEDGSREDGAGSGAGSPEAGAGSGAGEGRGDEPAGDRLPDDARGARRSVAAWAVVAGVCGALSVLSKINAVVLVGTGAALLTLALAVEVARRDRRLLGRWAGAWARAAAWATGSAALTTLLLWPALAVEPAGQLRAVRRSATQLQIGSYTFFDGEVVASPPARFVLVTLAWRATPWFLAGVALAVVVAAGRRLLRRGGPRRPWTPWWWAAVAAGTAAVYLAAVMQSDRKYDRYGLPALPFAALAVGAVVEAGVRAARARGLSPRLVRGAGLVASGALAVHALALAPYALSYVNPALGGQQGALSEITLGGDGVEQLGRTIIEREGGRCQGVRTVYSASLRVALPCGQIVALDLSGPVDLDDVDYVVITVSMRQRGIAAPLDEALAGRARRVDTVEVGGVTYAELWALDRGGPGGG